MPSFKKDDKSSPSNYRPISLLSCAGKVMERVAYKYNCNYIIEHSLLYSYQCGFLPGHSTVNQLLEIYHNIFKNIDSNILSSIFIFCDISKAFDRVWHKALIKKQQHSYGITGDLLHWLDDYGMSVIESKRHLLIMNVQTPILSKLVFPKDQYLAPSFSTLHKRYNRQLG
jgi:hypothetical protein